MKFFSDRSLLSTNSSYRARRLLSLLVLAGLSALFASVAWCEYLVPVQVVRDSQAGIDGLKDASALVASADGKHLYVAGFTDHGIAVFSRDQDDGTLTFVEFEAHVVGSDDGLFEPTHLSISADGVSLYVISRSSYSLAVFDRDAATGAIAFAGYYDNHPDATQPFFDASASAVTPAGNHVIVTFEESRDIAVYKRNQVTGLLTLVNHFNQHEGDTGFTDVAVSPNNGNFYVSDELMSELRVYTFDDSNGAAGYLGSQSDGNAGVEGLDGAAAVSVSSGGGSVYVAGSIDSAIANFERHLASGGLDFLEVIEDGIDDVEGLGGVNRVIVSPNGQYVFTSSRQDDSVSLFTRESGEGRLTFRASKNEFTVGALQNPTDLAVSPDSEFLYVSDNRSDAVLVFLVVGGTAEFRINPGLNGSWFDPATDGQGFLIDVFPDSEVMFVAWFTYDTEAPDASVDAMLGDPSQRWLTAQGEYGKTKAVLDLYVSGGGLFDTYPPVPTREKDGTLTVEFSDCNTGMVTYDITSIDRQGEIPIQRIVTENVPLCESLLEVPEQ